MPSCSSSNWRTIKRTALILTSGMLALSVTLLAFVLSGIILRALSAVLQQHLYNITKIVER